MPTKRNINIGTTRSSSGTLPAQQFTGQRLDETGLYYYNARYYDPETVRFISADTIVQSPANPQSFNRYSYCLNNPLKYTDPSGHEVWIGGTNVQSFYKFINDPMFMGMGPGQNILSLVDSYLFQTYDYFRGVEANIAHGLEKSDTVYSIKYGSLIQSRVAQYDSKTHEIVFNVKQQGSFRSTVLTLAHEARHAYQDILQKNAAVGSWDKKKWNDVTYREWDAHKFAGDLDDSLGWVEYRWPMDTTCYMQKLNLEVSYSDYYKAFDRLFSYWGSETLRRYRNEFIKQGWVLIQNDYNR